MTTGRRSHGLGTASRGSTTGVTTTWSLRRWVEQIDKGQALGEPRTVSVETPEQREMRRLRQENDYLRRQRDILKKALGILSGEMPPNDTP